MLKRRTEDLAVRMGQKRKNRLFFIIFFIFANSSPPESKIQMESSLLVMINVGKTSIYIERPTFTHRNCEDYLNDMNSGSIKAVYDYADKNEVRFAARLIQGKNYEDFLKLLRINNHSDVRLRELLAEAQNANDTVASAYIIKECSGRGHIGTGQLKI